jgi:hypothetical protein
MVTLKGGLTAGLALVDVEISIDQLSAQPGGAVIPLRRCAAIIDPGTNITCVDPSILQALGLTPFDRLDISFPQGDVAGDEFDLFKIWLTLKHPSGQPSDDLSEPALTVVQLALAHGNRVLSPGGEDGTKIPGKEVEDHGAKASWNS